MNNLRLFNQSCGLRAASGAHDDCSISAYHSAINYAIALSLNKIIHHRIGRSIEQMECRPSTAHGNKNNTRAHVSAHTFSADRQIAISALNSKSVAKNGPNSSTFNSHRNIRGNGERKKQIKPPNINKRVQLFTEHNRSAPK